MYSKVTNSNHGHCECSVLTDNITLMWKLYKKIGHIPIAERRRLLGRGSRLLKVLVTE